MKRSFLAILFVMILCLILVGCGKSNSESTSKKDETNTSDEYDYREGVLNQIVDEDGKPKQTDYVINGVILIGNQHNYIDSDDTSAVFKYFESKGYKKEGINSSFYLNERIEIYVDTKYAGPLVNLDFFITPHHTMAEYEKMSFNDLLQLAKEKGAWINYDHRDEEFPTYIADPYISEDNKEGKYDILFLYKQKIAYYIVIDLKKES